jgi:hypothetical protein
MATTLIQSGLISPVRIEDETQVELQDTGVDLTDGTYQVMLSRATPGKNTNGCPKLVRIDSSDLWKFYVGWTAAGEDADMSYLVVRTT